MSWAARNLGALCHAAQWLMDHGFFGRSPTEHVNAEGWLIGDLLSADFGGSHQYWHYGAADGPLDATPIDGWVFEDASVIVLNEVGWQISPCHGILSDGHILSNVEMEQVADREAPEGWTIRRGAYYDTPDDRADRWYVQPDSDRAVDRRGEGYHTIRDALDWIYRRRRHA